jgi:hypothetical protein
MKDVLTPHQMADLVAIGEICAELQADLVLIGAMAPWEAVNPLTRYGKSRPALTVRPSCRGTLGQLAARQDRAQADSEWCSQKLRLRAQSGSTWLVFHRTGMS